jgi:hypothetical protein
MKTNSKGIPPERIAVLKKAVATPIQVFLN